MKALPLDLREYVIRTKGQFPTRLMIAAAECIEEMRWVVGMKLQTFPDHEKTPSGQVPRSFSAEKKGANIAYWQLYPIVPRYYKKMVLKNDGEHRGRLLKAATLAIFGFRRMIRQLRGKKRFLVAGVNGTRQSCWDDVRADVEGDLGVYDEEGEEEEEEDDDEDGDADDEHEDGEGDTGDDGKD